MSSSTPPAGKGAVISSEAVAAYLEQNPGFLNDRPELLTTLIPPGQNHGGGVLDIQKFMLDRLQGELTRFRSREQTLLATAKSNADVQGCVFAATKALLDAKSFEDLIKIVL